MPDTPDKLSLSAKEALAQIFKQPHVPQATYRLQFGPAFTFEDALDLVDYLAALGISDLYASPLYKPRSNSTHGYDTVDYNQFNLRLGTEEDFDALADALRARDMSILLDIVPNHMGVNTENEWWMDVLKHGPSSVYADYFDIDWRPRNRALDDRVLLPVLGDHYGRILEAGEFELVYWHGDFYLHYYEHQFPITPESYAHILPHVHAQLLKLPHEDWVEMELSSVITALEHMPPFTSQDATALEIRRREQVIVRWRLLGLFDKSEAFRAALQEALDILNGTPGEPDSFDELDRILSQQPYYLAYWRVASDEINYRRFFDINDMAAIRIEDPAVFAATHRLTLRLLAAGKIGGLRIDHPDGLWSPHMYFLRLQEAYVLARLEYITTLPLEDPALVTEQLATLARSSAQPARWPLYVLAEKILSETEPLPYSWAVYGTTGYDFLNVTNNLFVDATNETAFDELYSAFIDNNMPFHDLTDYTKKLVMSQSLTSEIDARSLQLARVVEQNRRYRGFTRNSLAFAMSEIIAAMSIYRTYITGRDEVSERDRHYLELAVETAKQQNQFTPSSVFDFLRDTILKENWADFTPEQRRELNNFVMKFQQITGPVMAKSVEDTAFYVYNRLVSLNEVGGHPDQFGIRPDDFHRHNAEKTFPYTMLSSSTHDTKRSEDVRARINVLSEIPNEWAAMLEGWHAHNAGAKTQVEGELAPSRNDEYLLYQTLLGAYEPHADRATFRDRIIAYMHKAINEAKTHSNWINPNDAYARAIAGFVSHILDDDEFMEEFETFQQRVAFYGRLNALAQTTLKLTSPGVPDIYQGNELWDYSLVDPDNRRPVDFDRRRELLAAIQAREATDRAQLARDLVTEMASGAIKLYLIYRVLNYRQEHRQLFEASRYHPLAINGAKAGNACAAPGAGRCWSWSRGWW
jgi:(1->4)-alpha-D-glucan 1-alpha-D-glucosylmutase